VHPVTADYKRQGKGDKLTPSGPKATLTVSKKITTKKMNVQLKRKVGEDYKEPTAASVRQAKASISRIATDSRHD
jgi:hypothetical protein